MDIDTLLASQNPDNLRSLALKLLSENQAQADIASTLRSALEQQTQKNQAQAHYIQQLRAGHAPDSGGSKKLEFCRVAARRATDGGYS